MERKVVFFDVDGTIYKYDTGVPDDTRRAIKELKANGHIPIICTGRTKCLIFEEHLEPGFENIIAGAGTYVEIGGKEKYLKELEKEETQKLINRFLQCNFVPVCEGKDHVYLGTDYTDLPPENKKFIMTYHEKIPDRILNIDEPDIRISKISGGFTNHSDMEQIIQEFKDDYTIVNHDFCLLELIPKECNKAKGVKIVLDELGISRENTYGFGDSLNDLGMLEYVEYGCAMGNSSPEIRQRIKYQTEDFDKGGIYNGLKRFGLI